MAKTRELRIFPGKGLFAAMVALAVLAHGLLFSDRFYWALAAAIVVLVAFLILDWRRLRMVGQNLRVAVSAPGMMVRGQPLLASITLANESATPAVVHVRPMLPEQGHPSLWQGTLRLPPGEPQEIILRISANVRGAYTFGDLYVRHVSPRRLLVSQRRIAHELVCRVYPDIQGVKEYLVMRRMLSATAPHLRTAPLRGIGSEFESLRDYEEGDDVRRIDWKATARLSTFITRNYEIEHFRNVVVLIDRGRLMAGRAGNGTKLDYAIDAALMVCGVALDGGDRCGLMVFDQEVAEYLPPRGELTQLQAILESVYDLQPLLVESHFRRAFIHLQTKLTRRSMVLVLSDVMDVEASRSTLQGLLALNRRHLVVFAALRTPEIEQVVDAADETELAPYRQAVAYRLLRERTEVMARLEKGGVHVLDVRPTELTLPLVNKYITLREQNLL